MTKLDVISPIIVLQFTIQYHLEMVLKSVVLSNFVLICVLSKSLLACMTPNHQTPEQIQMQNINVDCICPNQFKEGNEASNEFKFEVMKTSRTVMTGKYAFPLQKKA